MVFRIQKHNWLLACLRVYQVAHSTNREYDIAPYHEVEFQKPDKMKTFLFKVYFILNIKLI